MRKFVFFLLSMALLSQTAIATQTRSRNTSGDAIITSRSTTARAQNVRQRSTTVAISAPATRKTAIAARGEIAQKPAPILSVKPRAAASEATPNVTTRTGAEYESCKTTFFTCMDQFCAVKNEKYRRCSCSDRIYELDEQQKVLESAATQINEFNANLDSVTMTAAQATATRKASEGELAMESDKSASKRLLEAIMNSISGKGETKIGAGALEQLNSVSFDGGASFGAQSGNQQIASYDGSTLYAAIYGQCREVVRQSCSDASLQRAVTAYLMAVENDCNTVSQMIEDNRKKMTAAVRESNAMLNLARVEDRQNRNSENATECLNAVEKSIKDEQVCGENYKKCLDNGEYINKDTGRPFSGVTDFYKLSELLAFDKNTNISDQKLTSNPNNRAFVANFVARNKKFAEPALGKCSEISATVWQDYLDKAMLEIHYAQMAKVDEIKRGCFDFVRECYVDGRKTVTDFMKDIVDTSGAALKPETVSLTNQLCEDYIQSCNTMFGEDSSIISQYIAQIDNKDILTTCRNVAKECFDTYGGDGYSNFYNPASGLFTRGNALDWFTLYNGKNKEVLSPCAKRLKQIDECTDKDGTLLVKIFGGVDKLSTTDNCFSYGLLRYDYEGVPLCGTLKKHIVAGAMRETGIATEIYNNITGRLRTECRNYNGSFIEFRYLDSYSYCTRNSNGVYCNNPSNNNLPYKNPCMSAFFDPRSVFKQTARADYKIHGSIPENMCPYGYQNIVDTESWGICSCWANGARRPDNTNKAPGCFAMGPDVIGGSLAERPTNSDSQVCPYNLPLTQSGDKKICSCQAGSSSVCIDGVYVMDAIPKFKN